MVVVVVVCTLPSSDYVSMSVMNVRYVQANECVCVCVFKCRCDKVNDDDDDDDGDGEMR